MQRSVDRDAGHDDHGHDDDACCAGDGAAPPARREVLTLAPGTVATTYRVAELDCATEERELRDVLSPLDGVRDLSFDLVARRQRQHVAAGLRRGTVAARIVVLAVLVVSVVVMSVVAMSVVAVTRVPIHRPLHQIII